MATARASDGARLFYRAVGAGPPLILSSASFSTHLHWSALEPLLAPHCQLISWDYRGHGRSEAPEEPRRYSLAQVVDDLRAVHDAAAQGEPAYVGGLSVGGLVSLSYYLAHPERVRALLLCNTGPGFKNPEALAGWRSMLERAAARLEAVGLEAYLEGPRAQAELLGLEPESERARAVRPGILASSVRGLVLFARHVTGPVPNLVDRLREIDVPALVLVGARDPAFQRASEVMAAKLPRARRVVLEGAGHVANLDRPEAFAHEVLRFLDGCAEL